MHWAMHCGGCKASWDLVWKHTVGQGELNLAKPHLRCSLSKGFGVKTTHGKLRVVSERTGWFIAKCLEFELMFMHLWKIKDWGPGGDWKAKLYDSRDISHETWVQRSLRNTLDSHKVAPGLTWKHKVRHCIRSTSPFFSSVWKPIAFIEYLSPLWCPTHISSSTCNSQCTATSPVTLQV